MKIVLTEAGKKWMVVNYPQGAVFEYNLDDKFEILGMMAEVVEVTCPMGIPYTIPHEVDGEKAWSKAELSFQEKVKPLIASIRNELERIEMHAEPGEGDPDYDTIDSLTDLIEGSLGDIRELIEEVYEEAEGVE